VRGRRQVRASGGRPELFNGLLRAPLFEVQEVATLLGMVIFGVRYMEWQPATAKGLAQLHPEERLLANALRPTSSGEFTAGRIALRGALRSLAGHRWGGPVLRSPTGKPLLPDYLTGSISHKAGLALGVAAESRHGHLGLDLELVGRELKGLASRVLAEAEARALSEAPVSCRWPDTVLRFSAKEALYKSLDASVQNELRYRQIVLGPIPSAVHRGFQRLPLRLTHTTCVASEVWCRTRDAWIVSVARSAQP
jgi:4'-phosphopantetheinyl transferase EntD